MSEREDSEPKEEIVELPRGIEVTLQGLNVSISLKSTRNNSLNQLVKVSLAMYEHLLSLDTTVDKGVQ